MSASPTTERRLHQLFEASIALKGASALVETVAGLALFSVSTSGIAQWAARLTANRLARNPHDVVASTFLHWAESFSMGGKEFYAWYLASHGLIKLAVVVALLLNQLWAYPASMVVLGLFVVYQVYRYTFAPSIGLILLTAFDLVVLWLIWHEYGQVRAARAGRAAGEAPPG